ncbi:TPA: hypothetical protein QHK14_003377 [Klebsiella pneumoniae]|uniref:hypothetical protein n=3 Tax=Klebsiella pneumoniae TaxID=573 RepID=UPI000C7BA6B4|nr:hypothetical protein [Klebsiella pneumoniae]HBX3912937.1 hypothetical protein [Klebsiella pneumoniae subsp. pneumoniae]ELQ4519148.1 hypothetical protein [Klebsiella pneumoniae]MBC4547158.1 hypothetical protein [Klebsiella pneumoniae]MBG1738038.1 hypothetical protein [Klebsiella pneumoniae]MCP5902596.1 hypothetical protein [Klebsiella pneumoniae]
MTIFFVTNSDSQTAANLAVAKKIAANTDIKLFGCDALRDKLHNELSGKKRAIFSMSHGSRLAIIDSDGNEAIVEHDGDALSGYKVYAWACMTAQSLGGTLAQENIHWWGYDAAITAPDDREKYLDIFSEVISTAKNNFEDGVDHSSIQRILDLIKDACDTAQEQLDSIGAIDDENAMSLYSCCHQIWARLCIWLPGAQQPIKHRNAPSAYIDM